MKVLLLVLLIAVTSKDVSSTEFDIDTKYNDENFASLLSDYEVLYGISEFWQSVKNAMHQIWDFIKQSANTTVSFIKDCMKVLQKKTEELLQKVKTHVVELKETLTESLEKMAEKSKEIREVVAKCYEFPERKKKLKEIFENFPRDAFKCVHKAIGNANSTERTSIERAETNKGYFEKLQGDLDKCNKVPDVDKCLVKIKTDIENERMIIESDHMNNRAATKAAIDDILQDVQKCVTKELVKASNALAKIIDEIGKCVTKNLNVNQIVN